LNPPPDYGKLLLARGKREELILISGDRFVRREFNEASFFALGGLRGISVLCPLYFTV
jgi:hypothetical protein